MKRKIKVCLGDKKTIIGHLFFEARGARESATFMYEQSWLHADDRFAMDPDLPLVAGPQYAERGPDGSVFPGVIADTEPDGWAKKVILRAHRKIREKARSTGEELPPPILTSLDFLLSVDDGSRVGALRFMDENSVFQSASQRSRRTAPPLIELPRLLASSRAVERGDETEDDLRYLRGRGTSLGGMRPKCTVIDQDGWLSIGKFPSVKDGIAVTAGEVLALRLARQAGIYAADAMLVDSDDAKVALIRRFDRIKGEGRILYASAETLLGKVSAGTEHTYCSLAELLRVNGAESRRDLEELWRRIAFSILITNTDDHLRNHGFLHVKKGLWRISPAFDINPTPGRVRELKTAISEDAGHDATVAGLMSITDSFGLSLYRARQILGEVEGAVSQWQQEAKKLGMTNQEIEAFSEAFEHEERVKARRELGQINI